MKITKTVLAITLILALAFAGCGGGGDGGSQTQGDPTSATYTGYDEDGAEYKLVINKDPNRAAYSPQYGDSYTLTITPANGSKLTSMGTVESFINSIFILIHTNSGNTFTVTVSGSNINSFSGNIPVNSGGPVPNPGTLTPTKPSGGGNLYAKAPPILASDTPINLSGIRGANVVDRAVYYVNAHPGTYTLLLNSDVDVGKYNTDDINEEWYRRLYQPNVNLTIIGNGAERKIKNTSTEYLFVVGNNSTEAAGIKLTLGSNVTLLGRIFVTGGAAFVMQDNAGITSSFRYDSYGNPGGSGVTLSYGPEKFETTFIMQDNASVYGHVDTDGGGVWVDEYCTFTMKDNASVYNNTAGSYDLSGSGGGVYVLGTFNMYGGTVYGNTATGAYPTNIGMGGGVYVDGVFNMYGGTVYGNDVSNPLANTTDYASPLSAPFGAALILSSRVSGLQIAKYSDGSNILPHTDGRNNYTNNTITGK